MLNLSAMAGDDQFKLIFEHNGDKLDTFDGTFTKNMFSQGSIAIKLFLSKEELDRIYQEMVEIDFFNYPKIDNAKDCYATHPGQSFYIKAENPSGVVKELRLGGRPKDVKLQELISLIEGIVYSKKEVKELPRPRYLPL